MTLVMDLIQSGICWIYIYQKCAKKYSVIVHIHGGGWVYGTKETYQFYGMSLAKEGFAFVNFTYHLGPDVVFPGILEDVDWSCTGFVNMLTSIIWI